MCEGEKRCRTNPNRPHLHFDWPTLTPSHPLSPPPNNFGARVRLRLLVRSGQAPTRRRPSARKHGLNPLTTGNPFLGTKLLGVSIGRGLGALKGSRQPPHSEHISAKKRYTVISLS